MKPKSRFETFTQDDFISYVSEYAGHLEYDHPATVSPEKAFWTYQPGLEMSRLAVKPREWALFLHDQRDDSVGAKEISELARYWERRPDDPIIGIDDADGGVHLWDGDHRSALASEWGWKTIPAIVGYPRDGNPIPLLALGKIISPLVSAYNLLPKNRPVAKNALLAKPTKHYGPAMSGVATHPGFHTGSSMSICQPYAQAKVSDFAPDSWGKELQRHVMRDYPVILELDMQGLPSEPDYDAANWFNDAVQQAISESDDFDALDNHLDFAATEEEQPSSMLEALFYLSGANPDRAVYGLRDWLQRQPDPDAAFAKIKKDGLPDELLAQVSGQFRYTEDVPTGRIVAVHYVQPVFNYLFPHYEDADYHHDKIIERIEAAGYGTVSLADVYDSHEVLTVVKSFDVSPKLFPVKDQRIEFHGTSWRNLMAAAPQLADVLPLPPKPFWKYDPNEEDSADAQA